MRMFFIICLFLILNYCHSHFENEKDSATISRFSDQVTPKQEQQYLLYEVNFGEGFNLRRDVYMRIASVVDHLREQGNNYVLVLPPWGNLYHWRDQAVRIPWKKLFDIESLNRFVSVIEFEDYLANNSNVIDGVVYLQGYSEGWRDGKWEERYEIRDCMDAGRYYEKVSNQWHGFFYSYKNVHALNLTCLSFQGESKTFSDAVTHYFRNWRSIFVDRAETILHDNFGSKTYWMIRQSMRYSKNLFSIADEFIHTLDLDSDKFNIYFPENWMKGKDDKRVAVGGNYISAHLRRRDFLRSHFEHVPSIENAAKELIRISRLLSLNKVFICTDTNATEIEELETLLQTEGITLHRFLGSKNLSDAEISIIDQIIASKARYFIGTHSSTFSYRIREDREIMRFPVDTTFNDFCKEGNGCEQPAKWTIVYK